MNNGINTQARSYGQATVPPAGTHSDNTVRRVKFALLAAFLCGHLIFTVVATVPGYLSIDEAMYHLMVKSFAETGGLDVWTGYREFPSTELTHRFVRIHFDRPVPQFPYLFSILAFPFFKLWGYFGLFIFNAIAFIGVIALTYAAVKRLFDDADLALNSCLILALATYLWDYSQAAWPHMVSLLFVVGSFTAFVYAYRSPAGRQERAPDRETDESNTGLYWASAAGLIAGFAVGIRVDAVLVIPCIVLPFLFSRPCRYRETLAVVVGLIPGLAVAAGVNYHKFGVPSPISYGSTHSGRQVGAPIGFTAACLALVAGAWIASRKPIADKLWERKWIVLTVLVLAVGALFLVPATRALLMKEFTGLYMMLVDLRIKSLSHVEPAQMRSIGGGVVYIGALKKAYFQSLPYAGLLLVPIISLARRDPEWDKLLILFLVPAANAALFGYLHDHGGLCLNMRYFVPALPFTAILCAYAIRDLHRRWDMRFSLTIWVVIIAITAAVYLLLTEELFPTVNGLEYPLLIVPLILMAVLMLLIVVGDFLHGAGLNLVRGAAWILIIVSFAWAGMVTFFYDYPHNHRQRTINHTIGGRVLNVVPPDSIFFTAPVIDPFMRLIEGDRIRIAFPVNDKFKDFPELVEFHLRNGRPVFGAFPRSFWSRLAEGPLSEYRLRKVLEFPAVTVARIEKPETEGSEETSETSKTSSDGNEVKDGVGGDDRQ